MLRLCKCILPPSELVGGCGDRMREEGLIFLGLVGIFVFFVWAFYESSYEAEIRRKDKEIKMKELELLEAQIEYYRKPNFVKIAEEVLKEAKQ